MGSTLDPEEFQDRAVAALKLRREKSKQKEQVPGERSCRVNGERSLRCGARWRPLTVVSGEKVRWRNPQVRWLSDLHIKNLFGVPVPSTHSTTVTHCISFCLTILFSWEDTPDSRWPGTRKKLTKTRPSGTLYTNHAHAFSYYCPGHFRTAPGCSATPRTWSSAEPRRGSAATSSCSRAPGATPPDRRWMFPREALWRLVRQRSMRRLNMVEQNQ